MWPFSSTKTLTTKILLFWREDINISLPFLIHAPLLSTLLFAPEGWDLWLHQQGSKLSFSGWVWLVETRRKVEGGEESNIEVAIPQLPPWWRLQGFSFLCPSVTPLFLSKQLIPSLCLSVSLTHTWSLGRTPTPQLLGLRMVTVWLLLSWHAFEKGDQHLRGMDGLEWIYDGWPVQPSLVTPSSEDVRVLGAVTESSWGAPAPLKHSVVTVLWEGKWPCSTMPWNCFPGFKIEMAVEETRRQHLIKAMCEHVC